MSPAELRELLELAAKAAGYVLHWTGPHASHPCIEVGEKLNFWSPSDNDGDSRRLQVALRIVIEFSEHGEFVFALSHPGIERLASERCDGDDCAAARMAVLHAAAEIGRLLP